MKRTGLEATTASNLRCHQSKILPLQVSKPSVVLRICCLALGLPCRKNRAQSNTYEVFFDHGNFAFELRGDFDLTEMCRYLAANAAVPRYLDLDSSAGSLRPVLHRTAVQPTSLRKSHLYLTATRKASMLKSGRGSAAIATGCSTPSKVRSPPAWCLCHRLSSFSNGNRRQLSACMAEQQSYKCLWEW